MKILFYTQSLGKGGAERVVCNLSNYLVDFYDVDILINSKQFVNYEVKNSINVLETDNNRIKFSFLRNIIRSFKAFKIVKNGNYDVVITFLPIPSFRILVWKNFLKCKVIVSERNDPNVEFKNYFLRSVMLLLYRKADGFVFQTKGQKEYFSKKIQENSKVILNPLNSDFLEERKVNKEKIIVSVGRLHPQKNQNLLIRACSNVFDKFPNYKLLIYGQGTLERELNNLIMELNLQNNVKLMGNVDNIKDVLLKSEIFVLSSNYEGLPNALMEAMACGVACISTDCPCGGPKELINGDNGILVEVGNREQLTDALFKLLENPYLRCTYGKEAKKIRNNLNPSKIYKEWEKYIISIYENK